MPDAAAGAPGALPVTVVVCSRNRAGLLRDTIDSILTGDSVPAEIVVVDQSDAADAALASYASGGPCELRYLWTRSVGVSRGRNAGIRAARQELVVLTDDDVFVAPDWLAAMARALRAAGPRAVVTGRVLSTAAEAPGGFAPALEPSEIPAVYEGRVGRDVLEAGNMAAHRRAFEEVDGFDERLGPGTRFPAGEDNDLGLRFLAAGYRVVYAPEATIHHRAWRGGGEYLPLRWRYGVGQGAYYGKHLRLDDRYMLGRLARLIIRHGALALRRLRREPRPAAGHVVYIAGLLVGAGRWWTSRAR